MPSVGSIIASSTAGFNFMGRISYSGRDSTLPRPLPGRAGGTLPRNSSPWPGEVGRGRAFGLEIPTLPRPLPGREGGTLPRNSSPWPGESLRPGDPPPSPGPSLAGRGERCRETPPSGRGRAFGLEIPTLPRPLPGREGGNAAAPEISPAISRLGRATFDASGAGLSRVRPARLWGWDATASKFAVG